MKLEQRAPRRLSVVAQSRSEASPKQETCELSRFLGSATELEFVALIPRRELERYLG